MENFYFRKIIFRIRFIYQPDFLFLLNNFSARNKMIQFNEKFSKARLGPFYDNGALCSATSAVKISNR